MPYELQGTALLLAVLLLSAWNLADEIQRQQDAYVKLGGRLLHPLPMPHYLS